MSPYNPYNNALAVQSAVTIAAASIPSPMPMQGARSIVPAKYPVIVYNPPFARFRSSQHPAINIFWIPPDPQPLQRFRTIVPAKYPIIILNPPFGRFRSSQQAAINVCWIPPPPEPIQRFRTAVPNLYPWQPRSVFRDQKNAQQNRPIMLYQIDIPSGPTLKLAEYDQDVEYPTGSGNVYSRFPLAHEGVKTNALGEIDEVVVNVENVDRQIMSYMVSYGGLLTAKVTMLLVFADSLNDASAYIREAFWVDNASVTEEAAKFHLTSKFDLYKSELPGRSMERDFCRWIFKQDGCFYGSEGVYADPGISSAGVECDHTKYGPTGCDYHNNTMRFGGFPGIPLRRIYAI